MADYTPHEAAHILSAYRALFPDTGGELARYWDYERRREWSLLTTDFHHADLQAITAFDAAARQFDGEVRRQHGVALIGSTEGFVVARRYREMATAYSAGYSFGVSPITDDLLLRTFSERTKRVVVLLAHDWYPIITTSPNGQSLFLPIPPLRRYSILDEKKYAYAVFPLLRAKDCAVVFLNLYPDFRGPHSNKEGPLGDYTPWVRGFAAVCDSIAARFNLVGVISWGSHVWTALSGTLETEFRNRPIMAAAEELSRLRTHLLLLLGKTVVPYFPFAHPARASNFQRGTLWVGYQAACARLMACGATGTSAAAS